MIKVKTIPITPPPREGYIKQTTTKPTIVYL
jgi:hypothetical protein